MITALDLRKSAYAVSFGLEKVDSINLEPFKPFFGDLPLDPYIKGKYRWRRLSRFIISGNGLTKLPHGCLFQSREYNSLAGDMRREFAELDAGLADLAEFQKLVFEFADRCKLSPDVQIGVHQIRTTCSPQNFGNPAPEGIHQDGTDFIGIFAVDRYNISGGATQLYTAKKEKPVFHKILNPGELLLVNDRDFFHYTTPIKPLEQGTGSRDVFVLTSPSLIVDF